MADKWITPKEASALMGVSQQWLYRARIGLTAGPPYYRPAHNIKYKEAEVLQFLELHRIECPTPEKG